VGLGGESVKFEPGTFFVGIIDFFAVLVPGAVVVYLLSPEAEHLVSTFVFPRRMGENEGLMLFAFASYVFGHFIFLMGSLLDPLLYDKIRDATAERQKKWIDATEEQRKRWFDDGERPAWRITRRLAARIFKDDPELAVSQAGAGRVRCRK
jgi:hypothetical protein